MKKILAALIGAILGLATGAPSVAQELTRAQAGRVEVAKCNRACYDELQTNALTIADHQAAWFIFIASTDFDALSVTERQGVFRSFTLSVCGLAQEAQSHADACYQACIDIERAYGNPSAIAKGRFRYKYEEGRTALRTAGLWNSYRSKPRPGTAAFDAACDRFLGLDGSSSTAPPSVPLMLGPLVE